MHVMHPAGHNTPHDVAVGFFPFFFFFSFFLFFFFFFFFPCRLSLSGSVASSRHDQASPRPAIEWITPAHLVDSLVIGPERRSPEKSKIAPARLFTVYLASKWLPTLEPITWRGRSDVWAAAAGSSRRRHGRAVFPQALMAREADHRLHGL